MKHNLGAKHKEVRTTRVDATLIWMHGITPTREENLLIGATVSTTGPHSCAFRCPCCDLVLSVVGPAIEVWERLRAGETLRPK